MLRAFTNWALSLLNISSRLSKTHDALSHVEERVRDLEEGMRVFSQELRHQRELDAAEREKLLLKIECLAMKGQPALPKMRRRKSK